MWRWVVVIFSDDRAYIATVALQVQVFYRRIGSGIVRVALDDLCWEADVCLTSLAHLCGSRVTRAGPTNSLSKQRFNLKWNAAVFYSHQEVDGRVSRLQFICGRLKDQ